MNSTQQVLTLCSPCWHPPAPPSGSLALPTPMYTHTISLVSTAPSASLLRNPDPARGWMGRGPSSLQDDDTKGEELVEQLLTHAVGGQLQATCPDAHTATPSRKQTLRAPFYQRSACLGEGGAGCGGSGQRQGGAPLLAPGPREKQPWDVCGAGRGPWLTALRALVFAQLKENSVAGREQHKLSKKLPGLSEPRWPHL